jgi:hypothetical protein
MEYKLNKRLIHVGSLISIEFHFNQLNESILFCFRFVDSVQQMLPLFMVLSWIFTVAMNVKDIVYEKEK